jgi:hypothetical protein
VFDGVHPALDATARVAAAAAPNCGNVAAPR